MERVKERERKASVVMDHLPPIELVLRLMETEHRTVTVRMFDISILIDERIKEVEQSSVDAFVWLDAIATIEGELSN